MRFAGFWIPIAAWLAVAPCAGGQPPPRWDDLPKRAAEWPKAWRALVDEPLRDDFEKDVLGRVDGLLRAEEPSKETYFYAETVLAAALRHHLSVRRSSPLANNEPPALYAELEDRLASVRKDWLTHLQKAGDTAEALRLAEGWLPAAGQDGALRKALVALWIEQARIALTNADHAAAQTWLDRLETHGAGAAQIAEIRKPLHERAQSLRRDSRNKTLVVAVRSLPVQMSPATAWTEVEKQALELLFDRLYQREPPSALGKRYHPQFASALPAGSMTASIPLRRDAYWSSGERVTVADVRHSALLTNQDDAAGRSALWRDVLEIPRLEGNLFHLNVNHRHGLFDPLAPLTFWILPQKLTRADDPAFGKAPLGSGPFQYVGRKEEEGKVFALFEANPHDLRPGAGNLREIRMIPWADPRKDLPSPLPHLILDAPTDQLAAFKELGYVENNVKSAARVHFLAVNQRKPALASVSVRQAIAHALDRQALLDRHFRGEALKGKYHATANGLFPRDSWASAPAPRVPEAAFRAETALSYARKAKSESPTLQLTLKYATGDERVKAACTEIGQAIVALFQEAEIKAKVQVQGLEPATLRKALEERDYDLLYTSAEEMDDPVRLALLFDRQDSAMRAGGSNYLGYDNDKLHELLRTALQHRQFRVVEESLQAIHLHLYETMPIIPLWQLDVHVLVHKSLRTPALDPRAVFATVREWKATP